MLSLQLQKVSGRLYCSKITPSNHRARRLQMYLWLWQKVSAQSLAHCFHLRTPFTRMITMTICTGDHRADFRDVYTVLFWQKALQRQSVTTKKLVSWGRVGISIELHQKRNIISNMAFPSWYSFCIPGFLPVSSTVPANYKVLWLSVTHVNVKVIFWHQIHIMENETVPVRFF